jgi:hypothetical protein
MKTVRQRIVAMVALVAASVFAVAVGQAESSEEPTMPAEKKTGYAPVNGLKMYYEITGEGKPAVYIIFSEPERLLPAIAAFLDAPTPKAPLGTLRTG